MKAYVPVGTTGGWAEGGRRDLSIQEVEREEGWASLVKDPQALETDDVKSISIMENTCVCS